MAPMTADGVRWEVRVAGPDAGRALLLLHGFTGRGAAWATLATLARRGGLRTVVVDLPGHGRSGVAADPARMTVERTADDLAGILARIGIAPSAVLGYSLGARVALRLAIAHPEAVARLVLESPSAGIADATARDDRRRADEDLAATIERDGVEAFVDRWERGPVFATHARLAPRAAARQRAIRLANTAAGLAQSLRAAGQGAMLPLHDRLGDTHVPTLVIAGSLDPARARAEEVAAGIPGARLAIIDGAGHTPHLERAAAFRRLALEFVLEDTAA
jgi:2-succinyl-6-hydroxy-2,4-cyclohexadiene-1-carboxylate synthase